MTTWTCPSCSAPNSFPNAGGDFSCDHCGTLLSQTAIACHHCGEVWPAAELDNCPSCDEPLSTIGVVMFRHEQAGRPPRWLERSRGAAQGIKVKGESESEKRMSEFEAIETSRLAQLARTRAEQERKDRQLLLVGLAIGLTVAGMLLAVALL